MSELAELLRAIEFAAHKHRGQRRKGRDAVPYINHPVGVAEAIARIGRVTDLVTLTAAVLHDTVEDTQTTLEEIEREFGADVRGVVAELTDDKTLPKQERKRLQILNAPNASRRAKIVRLADKIMNVGDITHDPPPSWTVEWRRDYFEWAKQVVAGCRGINTALERRFDKVVAEGLAALATETAGGGPGTGR
ncbi:MAG TPA: HD domain-containing protein [Gemmatimonadaceae bacterium]|nr:HD domain-containing protein [Gemmatimonadaceae bacterium]